MEMANVDYYCMVKELSRLAAAGRLSQVYGFGEGGLRLRFHAKSPFDLLCEPPARMNATKYEIKAEEAPSSFIMALRKKIGNARVLAVKQHGFDRVVYFELEKQGRFYLIFEMFAKGNVVLCDGNFKIVYAKRSEEWKDRRIGAGERYAFPKQAKLSPFEISAGALAKIKSNRGVVQTLATNINLGARYVEEVCARAGVDKAGEYSALGEREFEALASALSLLLKECEKPGGHLYAGIPSPIELVARGAGAKRFESFSEAIDEFYASAPETGAGDEERKLAEKNERKIKAQKEALSRFAARAEECRSAGAWLMQNAGEVDSLIGTVKGMRRDKRSWEEIEKKARERFSSLVSVDSKKGVLVLQGD